MREGPETFHEGHICMNTPVHFLYPVKFSCCIHVYKWSYEWKHSELCAGRDLQTCFHNLALIFCLTESCYFVPYDNEGSDKVEGDEKGMWDTAIGTLVSRGRILGAPVVTCVSRIFDRNSYENIVKKDGTVYCTPWSTDPYMHTNFW